VKRAYVVGSGPNGLTAAIVLARAGVATTLLEAQPTIGGAMRSGALTLPGFTHDLGSAVHPLALSSPAFALFPLAEHGLKWIHPGAPLAHPMEDGAAVMLEKDLDQTCAGLGRDAAMYRRVARPLVDHWADLSREILAPAHWPAHPLLLARFGAFALLPAAQAARILFRAPQARGLFAGLAAHSFLPLEKPASAAVGWVLALAGHAAGWPIPKGGAQTIASALGSYFESLGGRIVTQTQVRTLAELKDADMILCDVTPRQLLKLAGDKLGARFSRSLERYRYGPGVFKMDWALNGPIPWKAAACGRAATVHIGGTLEAIADSERAPWENRVAERPFVLLAQPSLFDSSRAPAGCHTAWAYAHVPNGSTVDMSARIEAQIERVAPGFQSRILARHTASPADLEAQNANLIGGDICGGAQDLAQMFLRPTRRLYRTPVKGLYLCSASTPPGGGVHGMCGYYAARAALEDAGINRI
jgi:phytoene dehydrogenase-like protein